MTISTLELAGAVLDWARTPGNHGGNPYCYDFVKLAHQAWWEVGGTNTEREPLNEAELDARQRQRHGEAIARRRAANTPWPVVPLQKLERAECDECGETWPIVDLADMEDFYERYSAGSPVPAGDCLRCGAFCYPIPADNKRIDVV